MWMDIREAPEGVAIKTKVHPQGEEPRNEQDLIRKGNLFWFPDMSMYVYYTPTHWK